MNIKYNLKYFNSKIFNVIKKSIVFSSIFLFFLSIPIASSFAQCPNNKFQKNREHRIESMLERLEQQYENLSFSEEQKNKLKKIMQQMMENKKSMRKNMFSIKQTIFKEFQGNDFDSKIVQKKLERLLNENYTKHKEMLNSMLQNLQELHSNLNEEQRTVLIEVFTKKMNKSNRLYRNKNNFRAKCK